MAKNIELKEFEGQDINELSMIEVAHAILDQTTDLEGIDFNELVSEVQSFLQKSDEQIQASLSRFYTDLNTDGSFIPLGNNKWGLRSWFAIDSVDEETISLEYFDDEEVDEIVEEEDAPTVVETDSEDDGVGFGKKSVEDIIYDEDTDDESDEADAYDAELAEVEVDAEIPENEVDEIDEDDDDEDDD